MTDADDEDFASLLAASERTERRERRPTAGDVVRGRVIAVGSSTAFVAVGGKAEAAIDLGEFRDPETGVVQLREGDEIEATVVDDGSRSGSIILKRVAGRGGHVPGELEQAFAHGIAIEGLVTGENKGGYDVQIGGVRAFCPGSAGSVARGFSATGRASLSPLHQRRLWRLSVSTSGQRDPVGEPPGLRGGCAPADREAGCLGSSHRSRGADLRLPDQAHAPRGLRGPTYRTASVRPA